ncbi:MAG: hypothetical protein R3F62_12010 [Planctomycetota bacterium]
MSELDRLIDFLPQTPPARYLTRILSREPERKAVGEVEFPPTHRVFEGHLPGRPLVPGVIVIEALAQLCGIALMPAGTGARIEGYLAGVTGLRFRRLIEPDERVRLEAELEQRLGSAGRFKVHAAVGDETVCAGVLTLGGMR